MGSQRCNHAIIGCAVGWHAHRLGAGTRRTVGIGAAHVQHHDAQSSCVRYRGDVPDTHRVESQLVARAGFSNAEFGIARIMRTVSVST